MTPEEYREKRAALDAEIRQCHESVQAEILRLEKSLGEALDVVHAKEMTIQGLQDKAHDESGAEELLQEIERLRPLLTEAVKWIEFCANRSLTKRIRAALDQRTV